MSYDKRSFLSGLALGRQLKGWVAAPRGWVEPVRLSGARTVHRGRRRLIDAGELAAPTDTEAELANVFMFRDGSVVQVGLGTVTAPGDVTAAFSGADMVNDGVPHSIRAGELAAPAAGAPGLDGAAMEITVRHRDIYGDPILPGVVVTPGLRNVSMVNIGIFHTADLGTVAAGTVTPGLDGAEAQNIGIHHDVDGNTVRADQTVIPGISGVQMEIVYMEGS